MSTKEMAKYFGPIVSKNGHSYHSNQDHVLIEKVEKLWMVIHQKHCVLVFGHGLFFGHGWFLWALLEG
jgi:hypothetical protein